MRASGSLWLLIAAASLGMAQVPQAGRTGTNTAKPAGVQAPAGTIAPAAKIKTAGTSRYAGSNASAKAAAEQKKVSLAAVVTKPTPAKPGSAQLTPAPRLVLKKGAAKPLSPNPLAPSEGLAQSGARFAGKRDPFVSIIREVPKEQGSCAAGKKCLVIAEVNLKGVVRSGGDQFAVVEDGQRRTFFLRENDPVFNG
ncbi:MAG TPA: hypothetical protein VF784_09585, partial [Anaerolineales bacterium]